LSSTLGITGPVNENLALRVEGNIQARDGFIKDKNSGLTVNDRNRWFLRGQALFDNHDNLSVRVILDHSETDEVCCTAVYLKTSAVGGPINLLGGLRGITGIPSPVNAENRTGAFSPGRNYGEAVEETGGSAEAVWDTGSFNLTSITSYRKWETVRNQDIDFNGSDRAYRDGYKLGFDTFTQEVRAQGEAGRLNWLVGAFYANEKSKLKDTIRFGVDGGRYADILAAANQTALGLPACAGFVTFNFSNAHRLGSLQWQVDQFRCARRAAARVRGARSPCRPRCRRHHRQSVCPEPC
jgi:hypothetical protein